MDAFIITDEGVDFMPATSLSRRAFAAGSLAAPFIARSARAEALTPITLDLDWTPWGAHAAFHLARAKGWYQSAGLDVKINDGNGSNQTIEIVGNNTNVDFGHAALSSMMVARSKGLPLMATACYARRSDIGVIVPANSGITAIKDLRGKRIGYTAASLESLFIGNFLSAGGLSRTDVTLVNLNGGAKLAAYLSGQLDGAFDSIPFLVPAVAAKRASRGIPLSDAGLQLPSYGLFAHKANIAAKKGAYAQFVSVSNGAWAYIMNGHQQEAVAAIRQERPHASLSNNVLLNQIESFTTFFETPSSQTLPIGIISQTDWTAAVKTMQRVDLVNAQLTASDYYTNKLFSLALYNKISRATS
jgi:NitT/TauT family transport system substrate-binding protein